MNWFFFAVAAVLWIFAAFSWGTGYGRSTALEEVVGAPVDQHVCSDVGCSFLVELTNGTRQWRWQPKLVTGDNK